ncbi:MAG: Na+/H+ antiporter NhaA [Planctomycetota bacterium]
MAGHDRNDAKRGGLALMAATGLALGLANGPWSGDYGRALDLTFSVGLGDVALAKPLLHWINDGLMAVFFLLIGLEIRREK